MELRSNVLTISTYFKRQEVVQWVRMLAAYEDLSSNPSPHAVG